MVPSLIRTLGLSFQSPPFVCEETGLRRVGWLLFKWIQTRSSSSHSRVCPSTHLWLSWPRKRMVTGFKALQHILYTVCDSVSFLKESGEPCAKVQCLGRRRMKCWLRVVSPCVTCLQCVFFREELSGSPREKSLWPLSANALRNRWGAKTLWSQGREETKHSYVPWVGL